MRCVFRNILKALGGDIGPKDWFKPICSIQLFYFKYLNKKQNDQ
jgi:hypothetical protein